MAAKPTSQFRIWLKRSLLVLLAVYGVWRFVMPVLDTHPEQDQCTFGPVSNARYQELFAEAKRRTREEWPTLVWIPPRYDVPKHEIERLRWVWSEAEQADRIRKRIANLNKNAKSLQERIAGVHAVMRAMGAFLYRSPPDVQQRWDKKRLKITDQPVPVYGRLIGHGLSLSYAVNSLALGSFSPIDRYSEVGVHLDVRKQQHGQVYQKTWHVIGEFNVSVIYGSWVTRKLRWPVPGLVHEVPGPPHAACPPIPPQAWIDTFHQWIKMNRKDESQ